MFPLTGHDGRRRHPPPVMDGTADRAGTSGIGPARVAFASPRTCPRGSGGVGRKVSRARYADECSEQWLDFPHLPGRHLRCRRTGRQAYELVDGQAVVAVQHGRWHRRWVPTRIETGPHQRRPVTTVRQPVRPAVGPVVEQHRRAVGCHGRPVVGGGGPVRGPAALGSGGAGARRTRAGPGDAAAPRARVATRGHGAVGGGRGRRRPPPVAPRLPADVALVRPGGDGGPHAGSVDPDVVLGAAWVAGNMLSYFRRSSNTG